MPRGIVTQFIQVLRGLNVPGVNLQSLDQRRARAGRVPAQTVLWQRFGSVPVTAWLRAISPASR